MNATLAALQSFAPNSLGPEAVGLENKKLDGRRFEVEESRFYVLKFLSFTYLEILCSGALLGMLHYIHIHIYSMGMGMGNVSKRNRDPQTRCEKSFSLRTPRNQRSSGR